MKKLLLILIIIVLAYSASAPENVKVGDTLKYGTMEVNILGITSDNVKLSVDGIKNIVKVGESKEIGNATVTVVSIEYFDSETSLANIAVEPKPFCGDSSCNGAETKSNCCQDCGCNENYECSKNTCIPEPESPEDECSINEECDDNDEGTIDICSKRKSGTNRKCLHFKDIICSSDTDCDDKDQCTLDKCMNNDCSFAEIEGCGETAAIAEENKAEQQGDQIISDLPVKDDDITKQNETVSQKGFFSRLFDWIASLF